MIVSNCYCDRCKEVVTEGRSLLTVDSGPLRARRESVDLCPNCVMAFEGFLAANADEPFQLAGPDQRQELARART